MAYARGLIPLRDSAGSTSFAAETFEVLSTYATAVFVGDPVILVAGGIDGAAGQGNAQTGGAYPIVQAAAAGGVIYGVVVGIEPNRDDLSKQYIKASTGGFVRVVRATQDMLFKIGADSGGDQIEFADVNNHYDLIAGAGSTTTGYSGYILDSSSEATAAKQVYLRGFYNAPDNDPAWVDAGDGTEQDVVWICSISERQLGLGTLGVGV
jgi:hypothetical protein